MNRVRMMLPVTALVVVALVATGLLWDSALGQEKDKGAQAAAKWEYKVMDYKFSKGGPDDMEVDLNKLGNDGWECTGTVSLVGTSGGGAGMTNLTTSRVIFKRPKS